MCDIQVNGLKMYEKALSEWREAHADAYSKFKQDLEEELEQPCHQILEMEDDYAKCLRSVVTNLTAHVTPNGVDFAELYSQALETGDVSAYCLCCYLLLDNGAEKFIKVVETRIEQPGAEEIIEDCMIAANVSVANFLKWQEIPAVYRIHEEPSAKRIRTFVNVSEQMGHKLVIGKSNIYPNELQRYLESIRDTDEYPVLSMMLLRCMQRARYDARCLGHFGLAEEDYLHFTSPIRRYPDLVVHRMLRKYSFEHSTEDRSKDDKKCQEYAEQSSIRERASADAEFAVDDMKKAEYMLDHIGEKFDGIITGVQGYGFYVELPDTVEGLVRIADLHDDYYSYNADRMELIGQRTKRVYQLGMKVHVVVLGANKEEKTVDFGLVGKNGRVMAREKDRRERMKEARKRHRRAVKDTRSRDGRKKKHR